MIQHRAAIVLFSKEAAILARTVASAIAEEHTDMFSPLEAEGFCKEDTDSLLGRVFNDYTAWVFIGAAGICIRSVAPYIRDKYSDPAVVCIDSTGKWVIPLLSGHVGGANSLAEKIAIAIGAEAVVTTRSDNTGLWPLDTLGRRFGWKTVVEGAGMNEIISAFVARCSAVLLVESRGKGIDYLVSTAPDHVKICYRREDVPAEAELVIVAGPFIFRHSAPVLSFVPSVFRLGVGCRRNCSPDGVCDIIGRRLSEQGLRPEAIGTVSTITLKKDEELVEAVRAHFRAGIQIWSEGELKEIHVPNPSEKVLEATGSGSVAEASAILSAGNGILLLSKQKGAASAGNEFTFAVAADSYSLRRGHVEIVGAGPGDPDLISVRGRRFLEEADLILYAGSLVPKEVTACARPSATILSSAPMALEEQFSTIKEFYDRGCLVVRLHTGDPCIYGAIQEQMNFFDRYGMSYHITPGISSFQAAAAELRSQFTIPEKVQTIILTRGEGRTPMPQREKLSLLARSRSTMCIFLSAGIAAQVQNELLEHYPPETPVAACHHLTWPDQKIVRGQLKDLANIIEAEHFTLTTMIVVGDAIDNRNGFSRLYDKDFHHIFR